MHFPNRINRVLGHRALIRRVVVVMDEETSGTAIESQANHQGPMRPFARHPNLGNSRKSRASDPQWQIPRLKNSAGVRDDRGGVQGSLGCITLQQRRPVGQHHTRRRRTNLGGSVGSQERHRHGRCRTTPLCGCVGISTDCSAHLQRILPKLPSFERIPQPE